jgi:polysaccharide export outer membrane protein
MGIRNSAITTVILGLVLSASCGISVQAQASPTDKTAQPSPPVSSPSTDAPANVAAANPKSAPPAAQPASGNAAPHPDVKAPSAPLPKSKADDSYIVGIADGLFISVWKEPDLSGAVVVRPDGMITVPVIGDVQVSGLTTPQVQDVLTAKLKDVVAEPQVTVIVRDIKSRKVYLVGKVSRPGAISLTTPQTVLQLLVEAGGPAQLAKTQKMYLLRTTDGKQKRIDFNYKKVLEGTQPDVEVMVGDIIVVP